MASPLVSLTCAFRFHGNWEEVPQTQRLEGAQRLCVTWCLSDLVATLGFKKNLIKPT